MNHIRIFLTGLLLLLPLHISLDASQLAKRSSFEVDLGIDSQEASSRNCIASFCIKCVNAFRSSDQKKRMNEQMRIDQESKSCVDQQRTLVESLFECTLLPKELIAIIALYNQSVCRLGRVRSVVGLQPPFVALGGDGAIHVVDLDAGTRVSTFLGDPSYSVNALAYDSKQNVLFSAALLGNRAVSQLMIDPLENKLVAYASAVSPEVKSSSALDSSTQNVLVWNPSSGLVAVLYPEGQKCGNEEKIKAAIEREKAANSLVLLSALVQREFRLESGLQDLDKIGTFTIRKSKIPDQTLSCDSMQLASGQILVGFESGDVAVISPRQADEFVAFPMHNAPVRSFAADGTGLVASGSDDTTVRIWDLTHKKCLQVIYGHVRPVRLLCFVSRSRILSISDAGIIRVDNLNVSDNSVKSIQSAP